MATKDKIVNLEDLKVLSDHVEGEVTDLKSDIKQLNNYTVKEGSLLPYGFTIGKHINSSGEIVSSPNYALSIPFYVKANDELIYTQNDSSTVLFVGLFDQFDTCTSRENLYQSKHITIPDGCAYVRFSIGKADATFVPTTEWIEENFIVDLIGHRIKEINNLSETLDSNVVYNGKITKPNFEIGKTISAEGDISEKPNYSISNYVRVNPDSVLEYSPVSNDCVIFVAEYNIKKIFSQRKRLDDVKAITLLSDTKFVIFIMGKTDWSFVPTDAWISTNFNIIAKNMDFDTSLCFGMQLFEKIGVICDSIGCGWAKDKNGNNSRRNIGISWVQQMARRIGCTAYNMGASGIDPVDWFRTSREYSEYCYNYYLSVGACDLYIIGLGLNKGTLGSLSDINENDYTQNEHTFYGQYARIVQMINHDHPNAIVMCLTEPTTRISSYDQAVRDICELNYINAELVDLENDYIWMFNTPEIIAQRQPDELHYTPYGYSLIAEAMIKALNDYISKHSTKFKYVGVTEV